MPESLIRDILKQMGLAGRTKAAGQDGAATDKTPEGPADLDMVSKQLAGFQTRLTAILRSHVDEVGGHVFRISLDKIKERMGERWDKNGEVLHQKIHRIIERRLSGKELYIRLDQTSYLLVLSGLRETEGQLKSAMITEEIARALVGQDNSLDFMELKSMTIDEAGNAVLKDVPPMDKLLHFVSEDMFTTAQKEALSAAGSKGSVDLSRVSFIYRPLLAVRSKVISTFLSIPICNTEEKGFRSNYEVLDDPNDPEQIFELDVLTANRVSKELATLKERGGRSLLAIPVHFESLATRRKRMAYARLCTDLFEGQETRIIFEIMGLPDGVPQQRLTEVVSALRCHCRAVIARFISEHSNFDCFRTAGLHAVGMDLFQTDKTEAQLMKEMDSFALSAKKNELKCYAEGIRSLSLFSIAITMGFDYLAGYAVSAAANNAADIQSFRLDTPFLGLLDAVANSSEEEGEPIL